MKKILLAMLSGMLIAGCGANPTLSPSLTKNATLSAKSINRSAYQAGLNAGLQKAATLHHETVTTRGSLTEATDRTAFQYGFVCGLLQGSINSFGRIHGDFDVHQWKSLCYMNSDAMQDALDALKESPELSTKYAATVGILSGGIMAFQAIHGDFDVHQWKSFAYSNLTVLENALDSLQKAQ